MKNYILHLPLLMGMLLFSSCTTYYYSMLDSNDPYGGKNMSHDFVQENDTAVVSYSFTGESAPVTISIYNKLDEPLYVDWKRSALIIDNVATNYYRAASVAPSPATDINPNEAEPMKEVGFIPPHSKIMESPLQLSNISYSRIPKDAYASKTFARTKEGEVELPACEFNENNSPLFFRSYLTLYVKGPTDGTKRDMAFERTFYISQVIKGGTLSPDNLLLCTRKAGDFFYLSNHRGETTGVVAAAIAVGAVGIVIGATVTPEYRY